MRKDKAMPRSTSRAGASPQLRGRVWVQIGKTPALTEAGADLLEQIQVCGSLSEAARRLRFAYRRAWMLIDAMNRSFPSPLVTTAIGGKKGGGARLTARGKHVLRAYRDLQIQFEHFLDTADNPFGLDG
jgi:molybdate transport system regulatory protein